MKKKVWRGILVFALCVCIAVTGVLLYEKQQRLRDRSEMLEELERNIGQYDEQSIVLHETSRQKAQELAQMYGAQLRITADGRFATLTLPEGTTIRDIYAMDESLQYIDEMAADYQVKVSELTEEDLAFIGGFASTAASLSTEQPGGIPSIPQKDRVLAAM